MNAGFRQKKYLDLDQIETSALLDRPTPIQNRKKLQKKRDFKSNRIFIFWCPGPLHPTPLFMSVSRV